MKRDQLFDLSDEPGRQGRHGTYSGLPRLLLTYPDGSLWKFNPRLLAYRIRHRLTGPRRGCSCSQCFHHPKRRMPYREWEQWRDTIIAQGNAIKKLDTALVALRTTNHNLEQELVDKDVQLREAQP